MTPNDSDIPTDALPEILWQHAAIGIYCAVFGTVPEWFVLEYADAWSRRGTPIVARQADVVVREASGSISLHSLLETWLSVRNGDVVCQFCRQPITSSDMGIALEPLWVWHGDCHRRANGPAFFDTLVEEWGFKYRDAERCEIEKPVSLPVRATEQKRPNKRQIEHEKRHIERELEIAAWRERKAAHTLEIAREREANEQKIQAIQSIKSESDICTIIKTHHAVLNGDPDRLSSDFLLKMIKGDATTVVYLTRRDLQERGWTVTGIDRFLGASDLPVSDQSTRKSKHVYARDRVEQVEASDAYRVFIAGGV